MEQLMLDALRVLAARERGHGFARLEIPGYSREQIDLIVDELRDRGFVQAAEVPGGIGENRRQWAPSVLTDRGRQKLKALSDAADRRVEK
jgi:hypothetical protein